MSNLSICSVIKCIETCTQFVNKHTKEVFCYAHGTVLFERQAGDMSDYIYTHNPYSDKFIYTAVTKGTLGNITDVARELNLSAELIELACTRYRRETASIQLLEMQRLAHVPTGTQSVKASK